MKLKYTKLQRIIELITVIVLFLIWIYLILSWGSIPDKIPGHYNAQGVVDRWGNKNEILALPIVSIALYILLTIVSFFPSTWNVPVKITEDNREFSYINLRTMLILIKMEILATFAYMSYCNIKIQSLGVWFLPLELTLIFGTITYYIIKISRKK
jgi:uncharacterized membrane protein